MRAVILGGSGMLGHELWRYLSSRHEEVYAAVRKKKEAYNSRLFHGERVIDSVDARDFDGVRRILDDIQPEFALNCVGVTKRKKSESRVLDIIKLNALFPHELSLWAEENRSRIIHFSTDCVFDGQNGGYGDESATNAVDLYGRTKAMGEVSADYCLTLRSSFIGYELSDKTELLEWFLAQSETVKGFENAIYTGLTTFELCRVAEKLMLEHPRASGLYNVSSEPITKFDLLTRIRNRFNLDIEVVPDHEVRCDRSLDSGRFRRTFDYEPPSWDWMIEELVEKIKERENDF